MKLSDISIEGGPLVLATRTQVAQLEARFKARMPKGYRDYVTRLGEGVLGGCFVRIYPPWRILSGNKLWRERIKEYWFWGKNADTLTQSQALKSILIGDSVDGDELVFYPHEALHLFILPRHSENIFKVPNTLLEAVEWMCSSGKLTRRFKQRKFEPYDSREE
jgi:hypothetical protein